MNSLSVRLLYRPMRIGWCIAPGDMSGLRTAVLRNFTLWGGRFNPIIPIWDPEEARRIADVFRVDCLYPLSEASDVTAFVDSQSHRPWFEYGRALITDHGSSKSSAIADLLHPINRLYEEVYKHNPQADPVLTLHEWQSDDALRDVFMMSFGELPPVEECAEDYAGILKTHLRATRTVLAIDQPVPPPDVKMMSLSGFNRAHVEQHYTVRSRSGPGFFVGDSANFDDLVAFWNLRATGEILQFYDPAFAPRLDVSRDFWVQHFPELPRAEWAREPTVWHRGVGFDPAWFGGRVIACHLSSPMWNGLNIKAPVMVFGKADALASVDTSRDTPAISFALTASPVRQEDAFNDNAYVVSVDPGIGLFGDNQNTLNFPFIPELNEFYGRNADYRSNRVRAEPGCIGVIATAGQHHLSLRSISMTRLMTAIFKSIGIDAKPSSAGLICDRLIRQMGGLDDCRVFRIGGVRDLIEGYKPDQSFTRSQAKQTIRGEATDHPLSAYQDLYIEPRGPSSNLTNDAVFAHLLRKEIFRPGLKLACSNCQLDFWRSIDEVKTRNECEYCGHVFNLGPQLKDRDWAFRRSGLFGRNDNQEGALPVILTLQQLSHVHDMAQTISATAMTLTPNGADIEHCETDFVLLASRSDDRRIQIAIGECKTRQPISEQDVKNLMRVASAFPQDRYEVFIVFSKLTAFSGEELDHIRLINHDHRRRAIILTDRELEPWHIYEKAEAEFEIRGFAVSFSDMAEATDAIFLNPKPRLSKDDSVVSPIDPNSEQETKLD
ncbi:hypothetical protein [Sphingomonas sp. TREG-RG-20F-R18-01]|uniref:hypothetical protein n=1 Tax=Sphingomonas sp. TREG-RG-20F-R18-01 TaxID=2914982 RepID=UPI001F57FE87|nr:hypothetical protein [Sphingomonas sp. TREG-RG-20F-R18-01]